MPKSWGKKVCDIYFDKEKAPCKEDRKKIIMTVKKNESEIENQCSLM